jgi:hypothetical protein
MLTVFQLFVKEQRQNSWKNRMLEKSPILRNFISLTSDPNKSESLEKFIRKYESGCFRMYWLSGHLAALILFGF